jgi:hypothetical protein
MFPRASRVPLKADIWGEFAGTADCQRAPREHPGQAECHPAGILEKWLELTASY